MKVTVLVENSAKEGFGCEHGLSLLVEYKGKKYIVDTGASALFSDNADKLGMDLAEVEAGFLSHAHYDHSGGYEALFARNKTAKIYLQSASKDKYYFKILGPVKKYIGIPKGLLEENADRFEYVDGYRDFGNGIYILPHTSKDLYKRGEHAHMYAMREGKTVVDSFDHEQTVVFETGEGLVLFNSCSHGGVENIIEEVKEVFPGKAIKAFFGGFHMMGALGPGTCSFNEAQVKEVGEKLRKSSNAVFYSGHCTGEVAFKWLKEVLGDRLVAFSAGMTIE